MAESNNKSGILAIAQKRISRTKTKVLQNFGKAEKTIDDVFNENVLRVEKQQEVASHLQKELKSYVHCLREMSQASKNLTIILSEVYEPEWNKETAYKTQLQALDLLWSDFLQKIQDCVVVPLHNYLQTFPILKSKIAKRGRKIVDYDNCRHHLDVLVAAKKKDEIKIQKAKEELKETKRIYEELNTELRTELPEFNNSRIGFFASLLSSLFGAEFVFHSEVGKINENLDEICQELGKDFEHVVFQPKNALSKSVSSISGENGLNEEVSGSGSPLTHQPRTSMGSSSPVTHQPRTSMGSGSPVTHQPRTSMSSANSNSTREQLSQPMYSNQDVPQNKQVASSPPQQNGASSPVLQESGRRTSSASSHNRSQENNKMGSNEDSDDSISDYISAGHSVYEKPEETTSASATTTSITAATSVTNRIMETASAINHTASAGSDDDDDDDDDDDYTSSADEHDDLEAVYSNPPSNKPLISPPPKTLYVVQATHKYTGEDMDELSFEAGEIIYVIEFENPEEQDDGWQMGIKASDGVQGVFPENFTQRSSAGGR